MRQNKCPHCGNPLLSDRAWRELAEAKRVIGGRGYIWEGARKNIDAGKFVDPEIDEMLRAGAIKAHPDPDKGYVILW